jgi:hypothetical protein
MFLADEGLAILGVQTFPIKAPPTLVTPAGVKHGLYNNGTRPMIVCGRFPALGAQTVFRRACP